MDRSKSIFATSPDTRRSYCGLAVAATTILIVWSCFLPWLAKQPPVKQRIEFLEEHGIDASAMFYTELDMMDGILQRLERGRSHDTRR